MTVLTRRQALLAGMVAMLAAVAGCDEPGGSEGSAETSTPASVAEVPKGRVRSGLVAIGDFGGDRPRRRWPGPWRRGRPTTGSTPW